MFIQTEETPNPASLKFLPGFQVMKNSTAAFVSKADCHNSPLATKLFESEFVRGVFLGSDFITITKSEKISWELLKPEILVIIMDHFTCGGEVIIEEKPKDFSDENDSEIVKQIKALIEERVRPSVAMDGGDIVFDRYEDRIVYLQMHGSCSGCPSSKITLKNGIENMLKHYIPEIDRIEQA